MTKTKKQYKLINPDEKENLIIFSEAQTNLGAIVAHAIRFEAALDGQKPFSHTGLAYFSKVHNKFMIVEMIGLGRNLQIAPADKKFYDFKGYLHAYTTPFKITPQKLINIIEYCAHMEYSTLKAIGSAIDFVPDNKNDFENADCVIMVIRVLEKLAKQKLFKNESEITPSDFDLFINQKLKYPKCLNFPKTK